MDDMLYPVTVFTARYGGTYEGAPWIAVQLHADPAMRGWTDEQSLDGCQSSDIDCMMWYENVLIPIGRGNTPDEAVSDLARQLENGWSPGDDSPIAQFKKALKQAEEEKAQE